jgi:hypothetical protein
MGGKAAIPVVAGHELLAADGRPAGLTGRTCFTGNDCRDDDGLSDPGPGFLPCGDDTTGDLVTEDQGEGVTGGNAVDGEADIGVADAASRHFHDYLVVDGLERGQVDPVQR